MDIFVHAATGLATGYATGHPLLGTVVAVVPDLPIMGPRKAEPPELYKVTHSLFFTLGLIFATFAVAPNAGFTVALALLSHLVLDVPTHGASWAPRLLYPYSETRFRCFKEWEFCNNSWFLGLFVALLWSCACLIASPLFHANPM